MLLAGAVPGARAGDAGARAWVLQVMAASAWPTAPGSFRDGWDYGLGLGGSLRRRLGGHLQLGVEAEFLQFKLGGIAGGVDVTGGARRYGRLAVPLEALLFAHPGEHEGRVALRASAGYVHESIEPISGIPRPSRPRRDDGSVFTAGLSFSRLLYAETRWSLACRYSVLELSGERPQHFDLLLGAEVPLASRRGRSI